MSIKNWILSKMSGVAGRPDLRSPVLSGFGAGTPSVIRRDARRSTPPRESAPPAQYLGPYAPLIGTIRDELEHFVVSYLSLHLAIAERDRYLLTSIEVRATAPDGDELLRRFIREFKPEQIKRYLTREVIAGLPNAGALDLSQFAGLNAGHDEPPDEEDDYSELLAELRRSDPAPSSRPFEVSLIGRWSDRGTASAATSAALDALRTPLADSAIAIRIEDAGGSRQVTLASVLPGRRYVIGKEEGCDVVVDGLYASRRHCEIWLERGAWWVTDAGSTNGIRVERASNVLGRSGADKALGAAAVVEIAAGARIVLSAYAEGSPTHYPRLTLDVRHDASLAATPIAPARALRATPSTPILATQPAQFTLSAQMASGERTVELRASALPVSIGRSRKETLVIDWAHEGVSGHHLEISAIDESGVTVEIYGDNGVSIGATSYSQGAHLTWSPGEAMILGRPAGREPECRLTLARVG
jgi:pSer/pThr/pTyr-binding forkhead associated (FHA) protein